MTPPTPADLRTWRELIGWSIEKAASALEVDARTLDSWEQGATRPPAYVKLALERLAELEAKRVASENGGPGE